MRQILTVGGIILRKLWFRILKGKSFNANKQGLTIDSLRKEVNSKRIETKVNNC